MAAKKKKKAVKAKRASAKKAKKATRKAAKKPARKTGKAAARAGAGKKKSKKAAKTAARKAPAKKAKKTAKKKQTLGEGDYAASRSFLKDQSNFVEKNRADIPAMGKDAEKALDGPEGNSLRDAEADAASRSRDTF